MKSVLKQIVKAVRHWRAMRAMPLRLEFVVTDHCNLNCKGCTHYSPLAPSEYQPLVQLEENMAHLARVCGPRLDSAYLIGGETLLYPSLEPAMEAMRRCFPEQKLYIFTNGISLPKMPASFWETARRTRFILAITRYPIKFDYDAAIELCRSNGVDYSVFADRNMENSFFRFALDPHKKQNRFVSHLKCYNRGCLSVIGDRLYPCSISGCVGHLNKAFGTEFKHCQGDYLIVPEIESVKQILRLRDNPVPFCSYCILPPGEVKYGPSRRKIEEWVEK